MNSESENETAPGPDFVVVGGPRCGTTALCTYLSKHPEIFVTNPKEPHFFGSDLRITTRVGDLAEYEQLFAAAKGRLRGEGSVFYLTSVAAASEIYAMRPDARIIIMLRDPVEAMHSLWWNNLFDGRHETLSDFEEALDAEAARSQGRRVPPGCTWPEAILYRKTFMFAEQVKRYYDIFGEEQVHTIVFDDFRSSTGKVFRETLEFLRVDQTDFVPELKRINQSRQVRSRLLQDITTGKRLGLVRQLAAHSLSDPTKRRVGRWFKRRNSQVRRRPPLAPSLRRKLSGENRTDTELLESVLGRKVPWGTPAHSARGDGHT